MKRAVATVLVAGSLILAGAIQSSGNKKMHKALHRNVEDTAVTDAAAIRLPRDLRSARL
jgi:hypothetical protein